jgi:tetraacyldisaccharide 4'-kinase
VRPYLVPLVPFYAAGMVVRNWLFDMGFLRATQVDVPVISVGNLDAGGAGKTPLVEFLARTLAAKGRKVAIVSRGYGRTTSGMVVVSNGFVICAEASASGDEPAQMAAKLSGVRVVVDEVRSRGAQYAVSKLGADVIVLDDGFQHRYLRRNVDIVVIPAIGRWTRAGCFQPVTGVSRSARLNGRRSLRSRVVRASINSMRRNEQSARGRRNRSSV